MQTTASSIEQVLSQNASAFYIPPFQRAYAWGEVEIDRFFDDIKVVMDSDRDASVADKQEHFFGVLVFKPENINLSTVQIIVDGQQRLTTTLLLLLALRDLEHDLEKREYITNTYLKNASSSFEDKIKLKQITSDWNAYRALVERSNHVRGKVTDGYNHFMRKILESDYSTDEYIRALKRVNIASISLDERPHKGEDPQIIFETLNSLGKPLTLADLIRNYVLLGLPSVDQGEVYDHQWHPEVESKLGDRTSHFFRDYLQYKQHRYHKIVSDNNTKSLYALLREYVNSEFRGNRLDFLHDIVRYVDWYLWIIGDFSSSKISENQENNQTIIELLRNIFADIQAEAYKPLVLGLLEHHQQGFENGRLSDISLIGSLLAIRTYLIRRRILKLTQGENREIPKLCRFISSNTTLQEDAWSEMLRLLAGSNYRLRIPNDYEIENELKRMDFYNGMRGYSKFILGKIEENRSRVYVDFRDKKITIEHVMPQKLNDFWRNELGENWESIERTYKHNIGNLILTEFNEVMGNKPLHEKQKKLKESNLLYRNDVLDRSTWAENDIVQHQKEMIGRFLETFLLPVNMKYAENWDTDKTQFQNSGTFLLNDDFDNATGSKPKMLRIGSLSFETSSWQAVLLEFMRWYENAYPQLFEQMLNKVSGRERLPLVANAAFLEQKRANNPRFGGGYKRLSDGTRFYSAKSEVDDGQLFVFANMSVKSILSVIQAAIEEADMNEEIVSVDLAVIR